jgi:hypothetical protein
MGGLIVTEREESAGDREDLERRFDLMKREVDELQIQAAQERTPWHRSPPVLVPIVVSIAAFLDDGGARPAGLR